MEHQASAEPGMIAVTGASGQLGTAFRRLLGDRAVYLGRTELDLAVPGMPAAVIGRLRPSLVINCAAFTAVDRAETERSLARRVNAEAVGEMAAAASAAGAGFVTFSTDYVFDGRSPDPYTESSPTGPLSVYGSTKLEGERLARERHPAALVIRTSWVLSGTHPNFAATMLRLSAAGEVTVVNDQRGHPTLVDDLAPATLAAVEAGASGLLHLTNQGVVTWFDLARECLALAGGDPGLILPCTTAEFPRPAPRPANSVLESERLDSLHLDPMPHFGAGLRRAIAALTA